MCCPSRSRWRWWSPKWGRGVQIRCIRRPPPGSLEGFRRRRPRCCRVDVGPVRPNLRWMRKDQLRDCLWRSRCRAQNRRRTASHCSFWTSGVTCSVDLPASGIWPEHGNQRRPQTGIRTASATFVAFFAAQWVRSRLRVVRSIHCGTSCLESTSYALLTVVNGEA